jgi:hypothetical protein
MLQAFTLSNNAKLKSELPTVRITSNLCVCSSVPLTQVGSTSYTTRRQRKAAEGACRPDSKPRPLCKSPEPSRQVSTLAEAATIENHLTPQYSFWRIAELPCKPHPHCDIVPCLIRRTDRSQRGDDSNDTHTAYVAAKDCRVPVAGSKCVPVCARDSRSVETAGRSKAHLTAW